MSDDLSAFLKARLDEDAADIDTRAHDSGQCDYLRGVHLEPERALREVAFKQAILAMHEPQPFWGNNPPPMRQQTMENVKAWYCNCQCPDGVIEGEYPCETVRQLAAVWSGHPDYRQEWKPLNAHGFGALAAR